MLIPFQPCQAQVSLPEHARDNIHVYGLCPVLTSLGVSIPSDVQDKVM